MYRKKIIIFVIILLGILDMLSIMSDDKYPIAEVCGVPVISTTYSDYPKLSVDQILVDGDDLYVLYGEHKGIIQVFDTNGAYQYTVALYDHLNGAFAMAVLEGTLYVRDSVYNVYVLRDGEFEEFIERDNATALMDALNFNLSSDEHQVRLGSIWCISDNQEYCVVQRPIYTVLYQDNLLFLVAIIVVLLIAIGKN